MGLNYVPALCPACCNARCEFAKFETLEYTVNCKSNIFSDPRPLLNFKRGWVWHFLNRQNSVIFPIFFSLFSNSLTHCCVIVKKYVLKYNEFYLLHSFCYPGYAFRIEISDAIYLLKKVWCTQKKNKKFVKMTPKKNSKA